MSPRMTAACAAKAAAVRPFQEAGAFQTTVDVRHAGLDELAELALLTAFADLDRAELSGPVVDILEQVAVDRAQVLQIERPAWNVPAHPQGDERTFLFVEIVRIGRAQAVSQNRCAGIEVRV